jgi:hypothetical protein
MYIFKVVFTFKFLKMALFHGSFRPGFLSGAGFHREEFAPVLSNYRCRIEKSANKMLSGKSCSKEFPRK